MKQPHEMLEALTEKGYCPTLLFDDDGHWFVADGGFGGVSPGKKGAFTVCIEATDIWYDNITDAVLAYLKEIGEEVSDEQR